MRFKDFGALVLLAAIWGSSYLFIKVAVGGLEPSTLVSFRLLLSAPLLFLAPVARVGARAAWAELRAAWLPSLVLGVVNAALPYMLIAWGEKHVDSGVAAIANSTVPMFVALLAIRLRPSERVTGLRLAGFAIGLGGVALLAGVHPEGGWWAVAGTLAVVAASLSYGFSSLYAQGRISDVRGDVLATGSIGVGGLVLLPAALLQLPAEAPGPRAWLSVVALALLGTVAAQLIFFRLIAGYGSARTTLVSYVFPVFAVLYGAAILDEPLTAAKLGGMATILAGVALGSGLVRPGRRAAEPAP